MGLVDYHIVHGPALPPYQAAIHDYLVGENGVFVRSRREGLAIILPVAPGLVRGLMPIEPAVEFTYSRIPTALLQLILEQALAAQNDLGQTVESLFHLTWAKDHWSLAIPEQRRSPSNVIPLDADTPGSSYSTALVELHSHHRMHSFFSITDDRDEQGFRIYAVLGNIYQQPELLVRVGYNGIYQIIPAEQIFNLPETIIDAAAPRSHETWEEEAQPC